MAVQLELLPEGASVAEYNQLVAVYDKLSKSGLKSDELLDELTRVWTEQGGAAAAPAPPAPKPKAKAKKAKAAKQEPVAPKPAAPKPAAPKPVAVQAPAASTSSGSADAGDLEEMTADLEDAQTKLEDLVSLLDGKKKGLIDFLGDEEGEELYESVVEAPDGYKADKRRAVRNIANAALEVASARDEVQRLEAEIAEIQAAAAAAAGGGGGASAATVSELWAAIHALQQELQTERSQRQALQQAMKDIEKSLGGKVEKITTVVKASGKMQIANKQRIEALEAR